MKRNLVRFVSHEIRTPLNTVNVGLDLLIKEMTSMQKLDDESYETTLSDMKSQCVAAIDILNDLLSYEKIDAGIMTLETSTIKALSWLQGSIHPFLIQVMSVVTYVYLYVYCSLHIIMISAILQQC